MELKIVEIFKKKIKSKKKEKVKTKGKKVILK